MKTLVLLRHGESEGNAHGQFTGWIDEPLTADGRRQAARSGALLGAAGIAPDVVHTSLLRRAIGTANLTLNACGRHWIPAQRTWRLNERHYGALQGRSKSDVVRDYGERRFLLWRRSFDDAPPPISDAAFDEQLGDPRYATVPSELMPHTESGAQVSARLLPYWTSAIVPDLRTGRTTCVVAHSNSLRVLVKHVDRLDDETFAALNIPTGIPLIYHLDDDLQPVTPGGTYLDPEAAAVAAEAVANEGR